MSYKDYLFALGLTIFIETIALIIFKERKIKFLILEIVINIITNITLNLVLYKLIFPHGIYNQYLYILIVLILEIVVVLVEAITYFLYLNNFKQALKISILLNGCSFLIGIVVNNILMLI